MIKYCQVEMLDQGIHSQSFGYGYGVGFDQAARVIHRLRFPFKGKFLNGK